jgi:hypothetical protein
MGSPRSPGSRKASPRSTQPLLPPLVGEEETLYTTVLATELSAHGDMGRLADAQIRLSSTRGGFCTFTTEETTRRVPGVPCCDPASSDEGGERRRHDERRQWGNQAGLFAEGTVWC